MKTAGKPDIRNFVGSLCIYSLWSAARVNRKVACLVLTTPGAKRNLTSNSDKS